MKGRRSRLREGPGRSDFRTAETGRAGFGMRIGRGASAPLLRAIRAGSAGLSLLADRAIDQQLAAAGDQNCQAQQAQQELEFEAAFAEGAESSIECSTAAAVDTEAAGTGNEQHQEAA